MKSHLSPHVAGYILQTWDREPEILVRLRAETALLPQAGYQISPDQGQLMGLFANLIGTQRYLELGTFTGYSSLAVMLALPATATAVCCDVSEEFTAIAQKFWQEAGLEDRIELKLGPALDSLAEIEGPFDLAFIDADKPNYPYYYEACLRLVRPGGVILIDNVLWDGKVANPENQDADTLMFRELNDRLRADERVDLALIPIAHGITVARVR
jgi:predicted O-methyltransferase YrrM